MIAPFQDHLPPAPDLNIEALSILFQHTSTSYKFVFFLALLELLKRHHYDTNRPYTYNEITVEMLAIAWYPHTFFNLSFGIADQLPNKLNKLELNTGKAAHFLTSDRQALRDRIRVNDLRHTASLMNFVPYRLIRPFIESRLKGVDTKTWSFESACPAIVNVHFERDRLPYHFDSDDYKHCSAIYWHPAWVAYLQQHFPTIESWAQNHWLDYMQRRNPDVTILYETLFPVKQH